MSIIISGPLTLSEYILCKSEVLGQTFDAVIGGIKVSLSFPVCPAINANDAKNRFPHSLLPPEGAETWDKGENRLNWGYIVHHPDFESSIATLAIRVDCPDTMVQDTAAQLYNSIEKWEHSFLDYLKLTLKQSIARDFDSERKPCELQLIHEKYIPRNIELLFSFSIPTFEDYAYKKDIIDAIAFASSGKELYLEYQMLLSSYEARKRKNNRQAIIDACSAVEVCLEKAIGKKCSQKGLDAQFFLKGKYLSLGDRFALIKQLDDTLGNINYQKIIVRPRNDVAHNNSPYPSDEDTDKLITCVEECLNHFFSSYYPT